MNAPSLATLWLRAALVFALLPMASPGPAQGQSVMPPAPRSIVELQPGRVSESTLLDGAAGQRGNATLINLNPTINASFLLALQWADRRETLDYHLENADPLNQRIALDAARPGTLSLAVGAATTRCEFLPVDVLASARRSMLPYAPLCNGKLYLRNVTKGSRSTLEATTEFLRDHVWRGEEIIGFVRREFFPDAFVERARPASAPTVETIRPAPGNAPAPAQLKASGAPPALMPESLGIAVDTRGSLLPGQWYAARGLDGVYVSVAQPGAVAGGAQSRTLDPVESNALSYLLAFDLAAYDLGFALGTEHPRLGWSARVREELRDPRLPGPDGIGSAAPLARTGMVSPALQPRVVATFTGGFKREHGAFRYGPLATVNRGSHYGFIEQGVVLSALSPGLATLYVLNDGSIGMKTWAPDDQRLLGQVRHARQNGVALIERDPAGGPSHFGALVDAWGPGNWSGSADEKLRSLRAGACLLESAGRRFLVYGYFSTATPRAMAQVFQAYGCRYAMHLDMNALEHTYLALYPRIGSRIVVEHLVQGMAALDKSSGSSVVPRFLGFADDRDFFYVLAREGRR